MTAPQDETGASPGSPAPPKPTILVVDDEQQIVRTLELTFEEDFEVLTATSGEQALEVLAAHPEVGVIVTDQRMPSMTGVELLARSLDSHPDAVRIILTGYTDIDSLIEAINRGHVYQYVTKPWEPREIKLTVQRAHDRHRLIVENRRLTEELQAANARLERENADLRKQVTGERRFENLIGSSREMHKVFDLMDKLTRSDASVLIQGETGTGKEMVARAIHYSGRRKDKPFVAQNCAALTETLLESELFGHKKGSFTGATEDKKGLFEIADGGTVFLDEIGETTPAVQVRLLRVLQEGEVKPVGATEPRYVDVRVLSATNRDLEEEVKAGAFREDLYYRLAVFTLVVPPLRERRADVPLLVQHFIDRYATKMEVRIPGIRNDALDALMNHDFPGNIRELENEIERAVTLAADGDSLTLEHFSEKIRGEEPSRAVPGKGTLNEQVDRLKRTLIADAIREHGSKSRAAEALGIPRQSLQKMMKRLQMS